VLAHLASVAPATFDGVLCDPPYGLKFMGKLWDHGVPGVAYWQAILRVCKPGAMLLAFGGTRTVHRLTCAIEDAGWQIRDMLMWVYGQGFSKGPNISKLIDKAAGKEREVVGRKPIAYPDSDCWGTPNSNSTGATHNPSSYDIHGIAEHGMKPVTAPATPLAARFDGWQGNLKPAFEPVVLAMAPLDGTFAANAAKHGVAGLNVDACRVPANGENPTRARYESGGLCQEQQDGQAGIGYAHRNYGKYADENSARAEAGRFPANLLHDGSPEVLEVFARAGERACNPPATYANDTTGGAVFPTKGAWKAGHVRTGFGDTGTAARFFYCAKSSRRERTAGGTIANGHPCIKPLALCTYLARLILPPERDTPRRLLVPFAGSGSEMLGALEAGWDAVDGVEKDPAHCDVARARIAHYQAQAPLFAGQKPD